MKKVRIIAIEDDLTLLDFVCTALEKMSDVELIDRAEDVDTAYALHHQAQTRCTFYGY